MSVQYHALLGEYNVTSDYFTTDHLDASTIHANIIETKSLQADVAGIGNLTIADNMRIPAGAQEGAILTSDAQGNASWKDVNIDETYRYLGEWDNTVDYKENNQVTWNGRLWVCRQDHNDWEPAINDDLWDNVFWSIIVSGAEFIEPRVEAVEEIVNTATSENNPNTIIKRDADGSFKAEHVEVKRLAVSPVTTSSTMNYWDLDMGMNIKTEDWGTESKVKFIHKHEKNYGVIEFIDVKPYTAPSGVIVGIAEVLMQMDPGANRINIYKHVNFSSGDVHATRKLTVNDLISGGNGLNITGGTTTLKDTTVGALTATGTTTLKGTTVETLTATGNIKGRSMQITGLHVPTEQGGYMCLNPQSGYNDMIFSLHRGSKGAGSWWWRDYTSNNPDGTAVLKLDAAIRHMRMQGTMQVMEGLTVDAGTTSLKNTSVNGDLTLSGKVTRSKELVMEQQGDTFGSTRLRLQNRTGLNGMEIDCSESTAGVCDVDYTAGTKNIKTRFESRTSGNYKVVSADNNDGEFMIQQGNNIIFAAGANRITAMKQTTANAGLTINNWPDTVGNYAFIGRNRTSGTGRMSFGVNRNNGLGGFDWVSYNGSAVESTPMALTREGDLTVGRNATINGDLHVTGNITGGSATHTLTGSWTGGTTTPQANIKLVKVGLMVTATFTGFTVLPQSTSATFKHSGTMPVDYRPFTTGTYLVHFSNGSHFRIGRMFIYGNGTFILESENYTYDTSVYASFATTSITWTV